MYRISKKILIANSLLALSAATPYDCHAADDWKKFLHNWQSGLESSEEEMEVVEQTPQRTPRFSSQSVYNTHYNQNKNDSSCESSDDSQSSVEEEMPNEPKLVQAQTEIQIPVIPSPSTPVITILSKPKTRNHHDAFGSSGAQSHPQKPFGMKKAKPNQPELSPTEQNRQLRIKELEEQQKINRMNFEKDDNAKKNHFLITHTKNEKNALQKEYEEAVNNLKLELIKKQQLLFDELSKGYNLLGLNQHVERVKFNLLIEEQKKNVLFKDLFLGYKEIDELGRIVHIHPGLPLEIWGNIFHQFCQVGRRSDFSLISKEFYDIAQVFTHRIKIPAPFQSQDQDGKPVIIEPKLMDLAYILGKFPNFNQITVSTENIALLDILKLTPNLTCLKVNNALINEKDDFSNHMTNLKSLTVNNGLNLSPNFITSASKIDDLSLRAHFNKGISLANDNLKLFTNLKSLNFNNNQLSDDDFKQLTNLTCLTISGLHGQSYTGLNYLTNLTDLTLPVNVLNVTTYKLLTNLRSLNGHPLPSERIMTDDSGKIYISESPVTWVRLCDKKAYSKDQELGNFDSLDKSNIETLDIHNSSHVKVKDFNSLKNLKTLYLGDRRTLTDNIFKPLTNLTSLYLNSNTKISDKAFYFLLNLKELSLVKTYSDSFMDEYNVTDKGLQMLSNLTRLDLRDNVYISNYGIQGLTSLTKLNLGMNTAITNEGIKPLTSLTELNLGRNTNITIEGVKDMNQLVIILRTID